MMTKEEVAEVIAFCDENKMVNKERLLEHGKSDMSFYAKRKHTPMQEGDNTRDFLQLIPGESFLPNSIKLLWS